jgi:DNA helicase IV
MTFSSYLKASFMTSHEEFQKKINKSLNQMDAKISYLHDGVKGLGDAFKEFESDISEFMAFSAESYADHEKRIKALKKKH